MISRNCFLLLFKLRHPLKGFLFRDGEHVLRSIFADFHWRYFRSLFERFENGKCSESCLGSAWELLSVKIGSNCLKSLVYSLVIGCLVSLNVLVYQLDERESAGGNAIETASSGQRRALLVNHIEQLLRLERASVHQQNMPSDSPSFTPTRLYKGSFFN